MPGCMIRTHVRIREWVTQLQLGLTCDITLPCVRVMQPLLLARYHLGVSYPDLGGIWTWVCVMQPATEPCYYAEAIQFSVSTICFLFNVQMPFGELCY